MMPSTEVPGMLQGMLCAPCTPLRCTRQLLLCSFARECACSWRRVPQKQHGRSRHGGRSALASALKSQGRLPDVSENKMLNSAATRTDEWKEIAAMTGLLHRTNRLVQVLAASRAGIKSSIFP